LSLIFEQFHFLRPLWLLLVPAALLIGYLVTYRADVRSRWKGIIAPHLLDALIVGEQSKWRFRPIHLVVLGLILGGLGLAGPTWERELPPFTEDTAPLVVALDLSQSMDAIDIQPSRLERAKQKIRDLLNVRTGARTALFVYSGSVHMVLPLTEDPSLMKLFLASLSTDLMPSRGKDAAAALEAIEELLEREEAPGTILFLTDGIRSEDFPAFVRHQEGSTDQIMVLGVGTGKGGPIRTGKDSFLTNSAGRRVTSRMDVEGFERLRSEAGVLVTTVSLDDTDVDWIQSRAQFHLRLVQQQEAEERWIDYGYYLTLPIVLLVALWFRRGWTVRWAPSCLLLLNLWVPNTPLSLDIKWIDLFLTPDQQGRYAFEQGDYLTAAETFEDPYWKGISLYRFENYEEAVNQFALLDSAEAYFYLGNCYARLGGYPAAVQSYEDALRIRPDFLEAEENRKLVVSLIEEEKEEESSEEQGDPNLEADEVKFDDKGKKGKEGEIDQSLFSDEQVAEMWMRNIQTSPADYLRFKFQIQASSKDESPQ
jgi:Ca-activated chloride channel family protein